MMSNGLYPPHSGPLGAFAARLLGAAGPQTAPAEGSSIPPALVALVAVGICCLAVWIVRRIVHPEKASLRRTPGRPNLLNVIHLLGVLVLMWLTSAGAYDLFHRIMPVVEGVSGEAAKEAADLRCRVAAGTVGSAVWLAGGLLVAALTFHHGLARGLGLSARRWLYDSGRAVLGYLSVLPVCVGLNLLVVYLFMKLGLTPHFHPVLEGLHEFTVGWKLLSVVSTVVLAPLAEEVFFRGLIQSLVRRHVSSPWGAILVASAFFAAAHYSQPQAIPSLFALAVALGYNYERTGRLFAPILIHALFNAVNLLLWAAP